MLVCDPRNVSDGCEEMNRNILPTVKIGGKVVHVHSVVVDPGNTLDVFCGKVFLTERTPTIHLSRVSIEDFVMGESNHVEMIFPARKRWKFPEDRFVRYEECDEWWCRILGVGREVEYTHVFEMKNAFVSSADYDTVQFVGSAEQKNVDLVESTLPPVERKR